MKLNKQNGNIMITVLLIFSFIMSMGFYIYDQIVERRRNVLSIFQKEKSGIEAENAIKIAAGLVQAKLQEQPTISEADMQIYLVDEIANHIPPPFEVKNMTIKYPSEILYGVLSTGPFMGMDAESRKLLFTLEIGPINNNSANLKNSSVTAEILISSVPITQFTFFSMSNLFFNTGRVVISGTSPVNKYEFSGRIHSNGDLAIAGVGAEQLKIRGSITSAQSVMSPQSVFGNVLDWQTHIALAPTYLDASLTKLKEGASSGCVLCDGTLLSWVDYAKNRWSGQLLDKFHKIPNLNIKTLEAPVGQVEDTRFIIEPVRAGENLSRKEKFAYKADIRIINGVWYLKNPANAEDWPGVAIWSDHPGKFTTWNDDQIEGSAQGVGQEDIRLRLNSVGPAANAWPAGTTPQKFSFYTYNDSLRTLTTNSLGTVSYGNLHRDSATVTWSPGHYASSGLCDLGETCTLGCDNSIHSVSSDITCKNTITAVETVRSRPLVNLLNATRGGFRVGVLQESAYGKDAKSKMWPMNFDLTAFQNALKCDTGDHPGELGCYFGKLGRFGAWIPGFMPRPFNGIVYIGNTWDGQNRLGTNGELYPQRAPYMQNDPEVISFVNEGGGATVYPGSTSDALQPASHAATQAQLPMQLCSTSLAGEKFTNDKFIVPNCDDYKNHTVIKSRINSLRIINARNISSIQLPKGITIASNLPVFSVGDVNSDSDVSNAASAPWSPVFIAGDFYMPLSNAWNDSYSRWDKSTDDAEVVGLRVASDTTINAGNSPNVQTLNENWVGKDLNKTGPHINFATNPETFFYSGSITYGNKTYVEPSVLYYTEDPHFRFITKQPPGVPNVSIFTINSWLTREASHE